MSYKKQIKHGGISRIAKDHGIANLAISPTNENSDLPVPTIQRVYKQSDKQDPENKTAACLGCAEMDLIG